MRISYKTSYSLRLLFTGLSLMILASRADAQVKIGTNGNIIAPASILELESNNQGLLLPRLADTAAINALNPPNGMLIYLTKVPSVGLYVRKVIAGVGGWEYITGALGGNGNFNSLNVAGSVTAGSFSGPLTGNATTATLAATATNSVNSTITNDNATNTTTYPTFVTGTVGNLPLRASSANLSFIPNTGILTAKGFAGPLVGNVTGTATLAIDATNAANTAISNDVASAGLNYPTFVSGIIGNLPQKTSSPNFTFVPSTGTLSSTNFSGNFLGNSTTATNAVTSTINDNNGLASPVFPTWVTATNGNYGHQTSSGKLSFLPSTGFLTAAGFTSTIVTGTPPFVVASSSTVANLSATNSTNINITNDNATITPVYPTFVTGTVPGYYGARTSSAGLSFVPSTGILTASGGFSGTLLGNATTATTATNAINSGITQNTASATSFYPTFVSATSGNLPLQASTTAGLSFQPSTGTLTATAFSGPLTGTVTGNASSATNATNAANVAITNDILTNATFYPTFVSGTAGNLPQKTSSPNLAFNPSSGTLSALTFSGALAGNATSSTTTTNITVTDDNATATATYPTFVTNTSGSFGPRTSSTKLSYVPSTGALTAGSYVSTIPTGTAPFVVASSTTVANLSATNSLNTFITDDVATAITTYPTFVTGIAGNLGQRTSNSRLTFIPSTGVLSSTSFTGLGTGLTGTAAGLNAGTATALQTARTINTVSFDGTANIVVTAAANTLTTTTLAAGVTTSSLTTVGTIANGTWNAGSVSTIQLRGRLNSPTVAPGAGAGVGGTATLTSGTDVAGQITVVVSALAPTGIIATITYFTSFPTDSYPVLYPANGPTAGISQLNQIFADGNSSSFTISSGTGSLSPGTYTWNYHIIGN